MAGTFRFYTSEWLTGGLHLIILVFAFQADTPEVWPYALAAMAIVSFIAWIGSYRRYRQIHDLPTSNISSAAQGYVELSGHAAQLTGVPVTSRCSGLPCCWYRFYIERETSDNKWVHEDSGASTEHFLLVDNTGECVISPDGAEVLTSRKKTWTLHDHRYTEWLLLPRDMLYAIGEFATVSGAVTELDESRDVGDLMAEWKKNQPQLLTRFDLDNDGSIDLKEWELARLQARREVRNKHQDIRSRDGVHILRQPRDGRLFLLADDLPDKIGRRFAFWSGIHLAVFFGCGSAALLLFL
ncbi:MAG: hypothetical protein Q8K18_08410 [Burkholderiales bacterium]|nr:hypothetical protein [Burkholderiales bacterium]